MFSFRAQNSPNVKLKTIYHFLLRPLSAPIFFLNEAEHFWFGKLRIFSENVKKKPSIVFFDKNEWKNQSGLSKENLVEFEKG